MDRLQVLEGARAALMQHGHTKYTMGTPEIGFCITGALAYAETGTTWMWGESAPLASRLADEMNRQVPSASPFDERSGVWDLVSWNNQDERTRADVVALLDQMIEAERCQIQPEERA